MICEEYLHSITDGDLQPEVKLWLYVLCEAIREAAAGRVDEYFWLLEDERDHVGSYWWCCEVCDICPLRLRELLNRRWKEIRTTGTQIAAVILGGEYSCRTIH